MTQAMSGSKTWPTKAKQKAEMKWAWSDGNTVLLSQKEEKHRAQKTGRNGISKTGDKEGKSEMVWTCGI